MKTIYLDNNGTTKMYDKVRKVFELEINGNASSMGSNGQYAKYVHNKCISYLANYFNINTNLYEIIFTSGASESNNSIILSSFLTYKKNNLPIIIISSYEHKATIKCCEKLQTKEMCKLYKITPNKKGIIEPEMVYELLNRLKNNNELEDVVLVSIMHINNEIGVKNDINKIGMICNNFGVVFHSDCVQSIKFNNKPDLSYIDALSLSFHKFGGPKGSGLLVLNKNKISDYFPIINGNQQNGYRGGTENMNIVLASTVSLIETMTNRINKNMQLEKMRSEMIKILRSYFQCYYFHNLDKVTNINVDEPYIIIFGPEENDTYRAPNTIYISIISIPEIDNNKIMNMLNKEGIIVSKGSTCNSALSDNSTSLKSIDVPDCMAKCVLRISLGDENLEYTKETVNSMHTICNIIKKNYK